MRALAIDLYGSEEKHSIIQQFFDEFTQGEKTSSFKSNFKNILIIIANIYGRNIHVFFLDTNKP